MALDILLAGQGGTCKVIATECCSYIPDNTGRAMHNLTKVLHEQVAKLCRVCFDDDQRFACI